MGFLSQVQPITSVEGISPGRPTPGIGIGRSRVPKRVATTKHCPAPPKSIPVVQVPVEVRPRTPGNGVSTKRIIAIGGSAVGAAKAGIEAIDFIVPKIAAAGSAATEAVAQVTPSLPPNITIVPSFAPEIINTVSPSAAPGIIERVVSAAGNALPSIPRFSLLGTTWTVAKALVSWNGLLVTASLAVAGVCLWRSCMGSSVRSTNTNTMHLHFNVAQQPGTDCETSAVQNGKDVFITHACIPKPAHKEQTPSLELANPAYYKEFLKIKRLREQLQAAQKRNLDAETKKQVDAILKELEAAEKDRYQSVDIVDLAQRVGKIDFMVEKQDHHKDFLKIQRFRTNLEAAQKRPLDEGMKKQVEVILKELEAAEKDRYQNVDVVELARKVGKIDFMVERQRALEVVNQLKPKKQTAPTAPGQ